LDFVSKVDVTVLKQVENREDLSVIGYKSLTDSVGAKDEMLEDLQCNCNNFLISGVQCGLDRDNELRNDWQDLWASFLEHVKDTLNG
jgi:hypothetical protein